MNLNINSVIHFAAFKAVNESIKKPLDYYSNNISGLILINLYFHLLQQFMEHQNLH